MSSKPIFNIAYNKNNAGPSPFWVKPTTGSSKAKKVFKQIWKWTKLGIFAFFMLMGLWGCFQYSFDTNIHTSSNLGEGFEFGFAYGTTGDFRYDLFSDGNPGYHTFTSFSMKYGPFYGLFVYPASVITLHLMWLCNSWWGGLNTLLSIVVLLLIIRGLCLFITLRSTLQNEKMTEIQGKIAEINAKYKDQNDPISKQKKTQEVMELYKKNKVKPFAAFEQMFITMPVFMIIYRAITIIRPIKQTFLFTVWNFALTPTTEIFSNLMNGGAWYILFLLIVLPVQFLSMRLPQMWAAKRNVKNAKAITQKGNKQLKKTKLIQLIFTGVMCAIVAFSATGVGVYWFFSALFSILQSYIMHRIVLRSRRKGSKIQSRLQKLGLE
ncbi:MAG: membrane protein insertase YidC [Mycoplasmataceae bacterium]|nr:membrane protein insertase YidC [Mycoplasmataceae bacterium]